MYNQSRYDSPPVYSPPNSYFHHPSQAPGSYAYHVKSAPPDSFYQEDVPPQHFYKWNSPPGWIRILQGTVIFLCVAIFACVASTLAWEYNYGGLGGMGGMGGLYGGYSGGYMGGYGYGYGSGYGMTNPQAASGFMMAMAVLTFAAVLGLFIASVSKTSSSRSRRFFMAVLVMSAVLATMELIASIVYIAGVNPRSQMGGSLYYSQIMMMCNQVYSPVSGGAGFVNQYLYHYCMVDPQEAIAIVCGFIIVILLCVISFFAQKTRRKIWSYGESNIYWDKPIGTLQEGPNVEEWVKSVPGVPPDDTVTITYSERPQSPVKALSNNSIYKPQDSVDSRVETPLMSSSYVASSAPPERSRRPPVHRGRRRRRNPELDESQYETDYTTAVDSGDDRDLGEWESLYPPISSDTERQEYKREFDSDLRRYKLMCAEMDDINDQLQQLNKQLDGLTEGSIQYQGVAEEYNRLKDLKRTPDYQSKKNETKQLRNKLFHIKRMVNGYDKYRS
ncbi:occludin [Bombina bombina]|uniref:occludin n=1 Tax=Bombina bombina TaxID=8345 RepID=UPI00235AADE5|nr:occludin [Bombina bombina]